LTVILFNELVEAEGLNGAASVMDRNEKSTLTKCAVKKSNLRLSCQLLINAGLKNTVIKVVEEREDVR
jgi:ferredoxin